MFLRRTVVALIFCSSFAPLAALIAVLHFDSTTLQFANSYFLLILLLSTLLLSMYTRYALKQVAQQGGGAVKITSVERSGKETLVYILPYLAAIISIDITDPSRLAAFLMFVMILSYFTVKGKSVFLNHVLAELGYEAYLIRCTPRLPNGDAGKEYEVLALAKNKPIVNQEIQNVPVSESVVIITKTVN